MSNKEILQLYVSLSPFLAEVCGPGCEVVVHDITDPEHSLIAIQNGITGREIGSPMTDLSRNLTAQNAHEGTDYLTNYIGKSKQTKFLSSTYYIKNEGMLIGLLCINKDLTAVQNLSCAVHKLLEQFNLTALGESAFSENLDTPVASMMHTQIADVIAQTGIPVARLSRQEKIRIVHRLNDIGLLTMKGAVAEIASQLSLSVPTVYRYLNTPIEANP